MKFYVVYMIFEKILAYRKSYGRLGTTTAGGTKTGDKNWLKIVELKVKLDANINTYEIMKYLINISENP